MCVEEEPGLWTNMGTDLTSVWRSAGGVARPGLGWPGQGQGGQVGAGMARPGLGWPGRGQGEGPLPPCSSEPPPDIPPPPCAW